LLNNTIMLKKFISKVVNREDLKEEEMELAFSFIMEGKATPSQIAAFITALRMKGETAEEICGAAKAMRKKALSVNVEKEDLLDTCGTGGDGYNTFNISTACAFVTAAAGVCVAKHGNRSVSSRCGSADLLEELGVRIDLSAELVKKCIEEVGIGFLFAPVYHPAIRFAASPRKELGIRTIFNLLGPLTNPAGAKIQLLGVYSPDLTEKIACVLLKLGVKRAMVVCGFDGMDEISICDRTRISYLYEEKIKTFEIGPEDFGIKRASPEEVKGGDSKENARIILEIFQGKEKGPKRDIVLLNSAAALFLSKKAKDIKEGIKIAEKIIDSGLAMKKLNELIDFTRRCTTN